ncbi:hypothetical protein TrLO_g1807 [Triparma laevis f. longispina]|uniref:MYND-type domain-containing protein n=1 Tax=Triparma laevis f. longispina TaxID=1714387 RepID=A0A9W7AI32_9STRA|nr:hypothetical protein TrLO_g1807 [Triparma laevis f. longispina]
MIPSQSPSDFAAAAKPSPSCAFPGCKVPPANTCSRSLDTRYCSKKHQTAHWNSHKNICVAPQKKTSAPVPPPPSSSTVPPHTCGFPGCTKKGQHRCSKFDEIDYCSEKHQEAHWKYYKKICVAPQKKISAPVPSAPPIPLKGSVNEEELYEDK